MLINGLKELTNNQRNRLNALHFFLGSNKLAFKVALLILDIILLEAKKLQLALELFESSVEVLLALIRSVSLRSGG